MSQTNRVSGPRGTLGATLLLAVAVIPGVAQVSTADPVRSCESLLSVSPPNTTIDAALVEPAKGAIPPACRVTATVTHAPAGDKVQVFIGLH